MKRICEAFLALREVESFIDSLPEEVKVYGLDAVVENDSVDVVVCVSKQLDKEVEKDFESVKLRIRALRAFCSGRGEELYRWAASKGARLSLEVLSTRVIEDREYALVLLENCEALTLRGFERNVFVPLPRKPRTLLFAHSHPRALAMFSYRDILSAANMLSDGVYEVCVVGVGGAMCLYRVSYLTLEDFEKLVEMASEVETPQDLHSRISTCESVKLLTL